MILRLHILVLLISSTTLSAAANAVELSYANLNVGYIDGVSTDDKDGRDTMHYISGNSFALELGWQLSAYRYAVEIFQGSNEASHVTAPNYPTEAFDGFIVVRSLLVNAYYDYSIGGNLQVFAGAGLGVAVVDMDEIKDDATGFLTVDEKDEAHVWQVKLGAMVGITDKLKLNLGYRYHDVADLTYRTLIHNRNFTLEGPKQQAFETGVSFQFQ